MNEMFAQDEMQRIRQVIEIFFNITGLPCLMIDAKGKVLVRIGEKQNYCGKLQTILGSEELCGEAHYQFSQQANALGEAYISYCPAGLVHYTVSISIGELFKAAIVAGPIHLNEPDDFEVFQVMKKYEIDKKEERGLLGQYKMVPVISPSIARYQLELLTILAKEIMGMQRDQLEKKKQFYKEQRFINENIQELKEIESIAATQGSGYPIKLENELKMAIIRGDESSAKAIVNELLGYIFFKHTGNNRKIVAMTLELIVIMSRASIEGGARYEDVAETTHALFFQAVEIEDIEEICLWLMQIIEKIILLVFPVDVAEKEKVGVLRKAIMYMNQHAQEKLTLEDLAKEVNLSTAYFSRVFSQEMKMTYVEYLSKIRVEQSKKYIVDTNMSISDIAHLMGFSDQSYFTKVFKKVEGMTPGKYRKMFL